jgi:preprotein translocase subunit SecY
MFQAYGIAIGLESAPTSSSIPACSSAVVTVITLVGGTMFLMWLGEQITARGIGNGISLIIFAGIVPNLPRRSWRARSSSAARARCRPS